MYQLDGATLERFIKNASKILSGVADSPYFILIKDKPEIAELYSDLEAITIEVKKQQDRKQ